MKALAIAVMWRFPLTAQKHDVIRRRLNQRRTTPDYAGECAR
jgi:Na+/melibiose symporter-like transporter